MSDETSNRAAAAAIAACGRDHPQLEISHDAKLLATEPEQFVVAVYMPLKNLQPSPYAIYSVDPRTFAARRMKATEGRLYRMKNDG